MHTASYGTIHYYKSLGSTPLKQVIEGTQIVMYINKASDCKGLKFYLILT
jgi:hypothetical protein